MKRRTRRTRKHKQRGGSHVFPDVITDDNIHQLVKDYLTSYTIEERNAHPIGKWDVSRVTNMSHLFYRFFNFNNNINDWDVSNVTNMSHMFEKAAHFNKPLDKWKTGNVTNMDFMFCKALDFDKPIGKWNVSKVTNMEGMFSEAVSFNQSIEDWDVSNVTNMRLMFDHALSFNMPLNKWKDKTKNVKNMNLMFFNAILFNQPIGDWNVSNVKSMLKMFYSATEFNQPIGDWDLSNIEEISGMFNYAEAFNQNLNKWSRFLNSDKVSAVEMFTDSQMQQSPPSWYSIELRNIKPPHLNDVCFNRETGELMETREQRANKMYNPLSMSPPRFKRSSIEIGKNETYYDIIDWEDVNVLEQLKQNDNVIMFYANSKYYAIDRGQVIDIMADIKNVKYECPTVGSFVGVKLGEPYLGMNSLGIFRGLISLFELWSIVKPNGLFDNGQRAFELEKTDKTFSSTASHSVMFDRHPNHLSASHCQPGQDEEVYEIRIIDTTFPKNSLNSIGSKNRTRKNTKSLHNVRTKTRYLNPKRTKVIWGPIEGSKSRRVRSI